MFMKLTATPQTFMTYGRCWAYSTGVESSDIEIGANVKFASVNKYVVTKTAAVVVIEELRRNCYDAQDSTMSKRLCIRQPDEGGECGEGVAETGTSTRYIMDLEGVRYPTRNKNEVSSREKNLYFYFGH